MASLNLPATMKAVLQPDKHSHKLTLAEQPVPVPTHPEDVLVKVHATSPVKGELDWAVWFPDFIPKDKIPVPGQDVAGTVVSAPANSDFKTGDEVYARIDATRPGAAAEYVLARVPELAIRPRNLSWPETAATPISALTAYQSLFTHGGLDPLALSGDKAAQDKNSKIRVLITAGAGGVGSWAVQLAREARAAAVVAVVGPKNFDFVRELGATEIIDYTKESSGDWVAKDAGSREFDLVFDCIGGPSLSQAWYAVRDGGSLISVCGVPEDSRPQEVKKEVRSLFFVITSLGKDLDVITGLLEAGKLKPSIDSVVGFNEFAEAWDKVESGRARGKVIVKVSDEA
ncbi:putative zinc-binding oxidoreductase [Fusarium oxysporum f. sp. cubense]|uniref:Putative zinc-binding oxidoreductase n=1 Tax=Fusarium oxysporum f. sp. cubense TaxID=61366 RepID=A0A559KP31_FUSOC|nr:putative zinc-binding oxidoreductase [Fusarium oxysporum f. sp. cubense]